MFKAVPLDANNLIMLLIVVGQLATSFLAYLARKDARESLSVGRATAENITKIEIATNSMKDALVKATGEAKMAEGLAEGMEVGREEGERKAAVKEGEHKAAILIAEAKQPS